MKTPSIRKSLFVALAVIASFTVAIPAEAIIIPPGGTAGADPSLTGLLPGELIIFTDQFFDTDPLSGTGVGGTEGFVRSAVYRQPNSALDFYYQVNVTLAAPGQGVEIASFQDFTGFLTDVYVRTDNPDTLAAPADDAGFTDGTHIPFLISRDITGEFVEFSFFIDPSGTRIQAGQYSEVLVIRTDAADWNFNQIGASLFNGGVANAPTLDPLPGSAIPEPGSMVLLGGGLLGAAAALRRRRNARA